MADTEELISGLGLVVSGLGLSLTIFFWPRPHSSLASLTSLENTARLHVVQLYKAHLVTAHRTTASRFNLTTN